MIYFVLYVASIALAVTSGMAITTEIPSIIGIKMSPGLNAAISIAASIGTVFTMPLFYADNYSDWFKKFLLLITLPVYFIQGALAAFGVIIMLPLSILAVVAGAGNNQILFIVAISVFGLCSFQAMQSRV